MCAPICWAAFPDAHLALLALQVPERCIDGVACAARRQKFEQSLPVRRQLDFGSHRIDLVQHSPERFASVGNAGSLSEAPVAKRIGELNHQDVNLLDYPPGEPERFPKAPLLATALQFDLHAALPVPRWRDAMTVTRKTSTHLGASNSGFGVRRMHAEMPCFLVQHRSPLELLLPSVS
jgi:hypothetical protein